MKHILFVIAMAIFLSAESIKPVMLYDSAILDDKSWNSMIHKGITRFEKKFKIDVEEKIILKDDDFNIQIKKIAAKGYNPIILNNITIAKETAIKEAMFKYPNKRYIILNGSFNVPNADFFIFSYHEATFLAGYLAAKKSKTKSIGFVGGMEIPAIKNFLCGYLQGAHYADHKVKVFYEYIGTDSSAWHNPDRGYAIASKQIKNGADIVFGPAGGSSVGILKAAHDKKKLGIGVDSNQNYLFPGSVLTSVVVRVDNAAYMSLTSAQRGIWRDQIKIMGLQEKGVGLAIDKYNASLISNELKKEIEKIKSDIILKKIKLDNYINSNECIVDGKKIF